MPIIDAIARKVLQGERLTDQDALQLFESADLIELGALANQVNQRKNSDVVFFNVNRHINPTNICALSCKFCAYSRKIGEDGAYAYSIEEMVTKAGEAVAQGATEVHMVGGLHPRWRFDHYKDMIKAVKTAYPDIHIKAFTAVELDWLARKSRKSIREVLEELKEAGLGSLPGGGAEIFAPEIRDQICETKVSAEQWLDTHRTAHSMGLHSNCTML
jgi:aminodeoxyfutalosine synthase